MIKDIRTQMAAGNWFEAADLSLAEDRDRAREIMRRYNSDLSLSEEERTELLRDLLGSLGEHSAFAPGVQVDYGYNVFVGKRCFFNFDCILLDGAPIRFGDDVWVAPHVVFATPIHPLVAEERAMRIDKTGEIHLWERNEPITVGNGVWIASNVTVNAGVTIGDGAVIGSGSVITQDIPPRVLAYGSPCKPIRAITADDGIKSYLSD